MAFNQVACHPGHAVIHAYIRSVTAEGPWCPTGPCLWLASLLLPGQLEHCFAGRWSPAWFPLGCIFAVVQQVTPFISLLCPLISLLCTSASLLPLNPYRPQREKRGTAGHVSCAY